MATIVREPLLNGQRNRRCRRKKFIAGILLFVFLVVMISLIFTSGKPSRKLHKSLHKLEDRLEDLQKSYMSSLKDLQRDLEATKSQMQTSQNQDVLKNSQQLSFLQVDEAISGLQQQLKETQDEMEIQKEAMKEFLVLFESYKQETNKELLQLKEAHTQDQKENERLRLQIKQYNEQKNDIKQAANTGKHGSFSPSNSVQFKNTSTTTVEIKPKTNPNVLVRSARAVKEYVSNLAAKLNPFRSSKDKTFKPAAPTEKSQALAKNIDNILGKIVSMLANLNVDVPIQPEIFRTLQSQFHHLDLSLEDYAKSDVGAQDRLLKWKKNYIPVKEQLERIKQEIAVQGGHHNHHKNSSKQLKKLANMTQYLKDNFHSLLLLK